MPGEILGMFVAFSTSSEKTLIQSLFNMHSSMMLEFAPEYKTSVAVCAFVHGLLVFIFMVPRRTWGAMNLWANPASEQYFRMENTMMYVQ